MYTARPVQRRSRLLSELRSRGSGRDSELRVAGLESAGNRAPTDVLSVKASPQRRGLDMKSRWGNLEDIDLSYHGCFVEGIVAVDR